MGENKVLESTKVLVENPKYVFIDKSKLEEVAERFSREELTIPSWDAPVYLEGKSNEVIDFFLLGDSINFAYTDFKTKQKFSSEYNRTEWKGAFGMRACLKKAYEAGIPILDGGYLKQISEEDMKRILKGNFEIPLFYERLKIFREVGQVLCDKYSGHFYNLVEQSNHRLFSNGKGIVERLIQDFPSFDDSTEYNGGLVRFDKRAQLGPGELYGRFRNKGEFKVDDIDELTVFADYVLPKGLRDLGILVYEKSLADKVDSEQIIQAESQEEIEIRASTIHAADDLVNKINKARDDKINALYIDYKLWSESRVKKGPHHLTITTAY